MCGSCSCFRRILDGELPLENEMRLFYVPSLIHSYIAICRFLSKYFPEGRILSSSLALPRFLDPARIVQVNRTPFPPLIGKSVLIPTDTHWVQRKLTALRLKKVEQSIFIIIIIIIIIITFYFILSRLKFIL